MKSTHLTLFTKQKPEILTKSFNALFTDAYFIFMLILILRKHKKKLMRFNNIKC